MQDSMRIGTVAVVLLLLAGSFTGLPAAAFVPSELPQQANPNLASGPAGLSGPDLGETRFTAHLATPNDIERFKAEWGVSVPGRNYNVVLGSHGTGDAPPSAEQYQALVGTMMVYDETPLQPAWTLPPTVDLSASPYFPTIGDQGQQGSCAAWNIGYYCNGYLQRKDNNWTNATNTSMLMSPAWVYNMNNYGVDAGTVREWNALLVASVGEATLATMPYIASDYRSWGVEEAWRVAPANRIEDYFDITDPWNTNLIKYWLAQGDVLSISFDADILISPGIGGDRTLSSVEYVHTSSNHAVTICGYDDTRTADGNCGAFKIANSWGKGWGGIGGYFWFTYDALAEINDRDIIRLHDKVDYQPSLLATLNESVCGSRDSSITIGSSTGRYPNFKPYWNPHQAVSTVPLFPTFMAFDITDQSEDVGLAGYWLQMGTGRSGTANVRSFGLEWYPSGYDPNGTKQTIYSNETPKVAPATLNIGEMEDVHTRFTFPLNGGWSHGTVPLAGHVSDRINRTIFSEDFESWNTADGWTVKDVYKTGLEYNGWATSDHRADSGERSAWAAGSDDGRLYIEDFNGGWPPSGWATASAGPNNYPFARSNSLPRGCGPRDYIATANGARGAGTNMTERLYMTVPVNASSHQNLSLEFYLDYDFNSTDEWTEVLYSNSSTYPVFTVLQTYMADTLGYRTLNLSFMDGEPKVYIGFRYHATDDNYVAIDDVAIAGNKTTYDGGMNAYFEKDFGTLTGYDGATLDYSYWLDSEAPNDHLVTYYGNQSSPNAMIPLDNRSGGGRSWNSTAFEVPLNATRAGFMFRSDASGTLEGAYIDDVRLNGYTKLDDVMISIDGGSWTLMGNSADWSFGWDSSASWEGAHLAAIRANYGGLHAFSHVHFNIDNTPPVLLDSWNEKMYTGDPTSAFMNASDPRGIRKAEVVYSSNGGQLQFADGSDAGNGTWAGDFIVPPDAVTLSYRFWVEDGVGNGVHSPWRDVPVIDNDPPVLENDTTPSCATTGDPLTFGLSPKDNIAVANATLEYWYGCGEHSRIFAGEAPFVKTITVRNTLQELHYFYSASDTSGNTAVGDIRNITISDNKCPQLADRTPRAATTGDPFTFSCAASDNIDLSSVQLEYWYGTGNHNKAYMKGGPVFSVQASMPHGLTPLTYTLKATDSSGNTARTAPKNVTITDNDPPVLVEDGSPALANTGKEYRFHLVATDNIAIRSIEVEYRFGPGLAAKRIVESDRPLVITVPEYSLEPLYYSVHVTDTSGNSIATGERAVPVLDASPPVILQDVSDAIATTGDPFHLSVEARDNIGITWIVARYWLDGEEPVLGMLFGEGPYSNDIYIPSGATGKLHYQFIARDAAGNENSGGEVALDIQDNDAPVFTDDATPSDAVPGAVTFGVLATDNIGVTSIVLVYWTPDGQENRRTLSNEGSGDRWTAQVELGKGPVRYRFEAADGSGNTAASDTSAVQVGPVGQVQAGSPPESSNVLPVALGALVVILAVLLVIAILYARKKAAKS